MVNSQNENCSSAQSRVFVTYDDRLQLLDGIKLLCLSFIRHCSKEQLKIFLPQIPKDFISWKERHTNSNVELIQIDSAFSGWSIKPQLLKSLIDQGFEEVIWLDSDILISSEINFCSNSLDTSSILIASNKGIPDDRRASFWNLSVIRRFEELLNTCFLRVTPFHQELLIAWQELVSRQEFRQVQLLPFEQRPSYLFSDQDLLEGLLMSESFSHIPVQLLQCYHDIVHTSSSYSIRDRISVVIRQLRTGKTPILLHSHGLKPWMLIYREPNSLNLGDVIVELSPYTAFAKPYRQLLESDTSWMDTRTGLGGFCSVIGLYNPHLRGIPVLLLESFRRRVVNSSTSSLLKKYKLFAKK